MIDIGVVGSSRNVVLMNEVDINKTGLNSGDTVTVKNDTGTMG